MEELKQKKAVVENMSTAELGRKTQAFLDNEEPFFNLHEFVIEVITKNRCHFYHLPPDKVS